MTKLEHIESRLHRNSIKMYEFAIDDSIKAMSHIVGGRKTIALNRGALRGKSDKVSVLAEELGHFEANALYVITPSYNTQVHRSTRIKCEAKAKHWAYTQYCEPEEIEQAYECEGMYGDFAVAEYCSVTVEFLHKAIEYHRSCGYVFSFDKTG